MRAVQKLSYLFARGHLRTAVSKTAARVRTEAERHLAWLRSGPAFECPCCSYHGRFVTFRGRLWSECPSCRSKERHRVLRLVLDEVLRGEPSLRILHVAPEPALQAWLSQRGRYFATDLARGFNREDYCLSFSADLTCLPVADASFDLVIAAHVLEHISDDSAAIGEIFRVLKPGGRAILPVPVVADSTVEYGEPRSDEEEHVRAPGLDYFERYRRAGFTLSVRESSHYPEKCQPFCYDVSRHAPGRRRRLRERLTEYVPVCTVTAGALT